MLWPTDILSLETWILIGTVIFLIRYFLYRKWSYFKNLNIPYETPSILGIGNMLDSMKKRPFTFDLDMREKHGSIWGSFLGVMPLLHIYDVSILRQIFIKEFSNFPNRQVTRSNLAGKELNTALTAVDGSQWKRIRSTMTPAFSTSKLKHMTGVIEWCAGNTVDILNKKCETGDGTFNAKGVFSRLSMDVMLSSAFSTKVHSQDDSKTEPEISVQAKKLFQRSILSVFFILFFFIPGVARLFEKLNITSMKKGPLGYFKRLTNTIIEKRNENPHTKDRADLMQQLLDNEISEELSAKEPEKGMTKTEIVGNSMLLILAGYENTANTMAFLAYNLAQHPEIQAQVQEEIDEMMENNGKMNYEGVNSLKLLDMCLNESLRLYMPILRNVRASVNEITLNGFTIPPKAIIAIPTYALAHDPEYWEEPMKFNPERMRDMSQIDPVVFQPFGLGPRNCIGMRFAVIEVKMTLAKLLYNFTIKPAANTPPPPLELTASAGVRPKVDFDLKAIPRERPQDRIG